MRNRLALALLLVLAPTAAAQSPPPPIARAVPRIDTLHGEIRQDDYFKYTFMLDAVGLAPRPTPTP